MNGQRKKKHSLLKKTVSAAVASVFCFGAVATVAAFTQTVKVTDGEDSAVSTRSYTPKLDSKEVSVIESEVGQSMLSAFGVVSEKEESIDESSLITANTETATALAASNESSENEVVINEWRSIIINLRGEVQNKDVPAGTVGDALAYLDIELTKNDKLNVEKDMELTDGTEIDIDRITYKKVTTTEVVDYKTINKDTSTLFVGESLVDTYGVEGERTIVTKEKYINGEKVSEEEISNKITTKPVNEVILNGTAEIQPETIDTDYGEIEVNEELGTITDTNGNTLYYTDVITGSSTAYTAEAGAICSTGREARYGVVAVDPDVIPYGSILYIVSDDGFVYGYAVAGDTGGFIYNGTGTVVDLYFPTLDECVNYGRRGINVYVLDGVSEDATY